VEDLAGIGGERSALSAHEPGRAISGASASTLASTALVPGSDEWFARPLADVRSDAVAELVRQYVKRLLRRSAGRVGRAAELADLDPRTLYELMRRHGLRKEDYKG
jgi:DNA-binding NtrC family response regulator